MKEDNISPQNLMDVIQKHIFQFTIWKDDNFIKVSDIGYQWKENAIKDYVLIVGV